MCCLSPIPSKKVCFQLTCLISEMIYHVSSGMLNPTHSLTHSCISVSMSRVFGNKLLTLRADGTLFQTHSRSMELCCRVSVELRWFFHCFWFCFLLICFQRTITDMQARSWFLVFCVYSAEVQNANLKPGNLQ